MIKNLLKLIFLLSCTTILLESCTKKTTKAKFQVVKTDTLSMAGLAVHSNIKLDSLDVITQSKEIQDFYVLNNYALAWQNNESRAELIEYIKQVSLEGISPKLYPLQELQRSDSLYFSGEKEDIIATDLLFSKIYMRAAKHIYNGVVNPKRAYKDWDLEPKSINLSATMLWVLADNAVLQSFDSLRPLHKQYHLLRQKLVQLADDSKDSLPKLNTNFELDQTYPNTKHLKASLNTLGYLDKDFKNDNVFDSLTQKALTKLQNKYKVAPTLLFGQKTLDALKSEQELLHQKAVVNMERYRWFAADYGKDYIIVNIAAYNLWAISQRDTLINSKVIVGTMNRKTPILNSTLTSIVVNPTWTVPPTILKNDVVPKASKDSMYFYKQNFTLVEKATGKAIDIKNWSAQNYSKYHYIQKGGPGNTLGRVKFLFKNNHAVYLHDTPNKGYFDRGQRGLSSGCVRVQDPFNLAKYIWNVQGKQMDQSELEQIIDSEKTTNFSLKGTDIQIHQLYWTIDITNSQGVIYHNDPYKYDQELYQKLQ